MSHFRRAYRTWLVPNRLCDGVIRLAIRVDLASAGVRRVSGTILPPLSTGQFLRASLYQPHTNRCSPLIPSTIETYMKNCFLPPIQIPPFEISTHRDT